MMEVRSLETAEPFVSDDGSVIRELHGRVSSSARGQSLAEATIEPGQATARHYHAEMEEIYLITEGRGEMELDGERREVGVGDAVLIPPGARHQIRALGEGGLRLLCACAPAYRPEDTFFD
jgi:mannose-6-phosphate isomerase-like protein (cupin superfamily)